jgi:hypothetical protein
VLGALLLGTACGSDPLPAGGADLDDVVCEGAVCTEADADDGARDQGTPRPRDPMPPPGAGGQDRGPAEPGTDASQPTPDPDPDPGTDAPDATHPGPAWRLCDTDSDCPDLGTRCIHSVTLSHAPNDGSSAERRIEDLFDGEPGNGRGVCSTECTQPGTTCERIEDHARRGAWTCQLVAQGPAIHPGEDIEGPWDLSLVPPISEAERLRGRPYAALCRPPARAPGFCEACVSDATCGRGMVCGQATSGTHALDRAGRFCLAPCPEDRRCGPGFTCLHSPEGTPVCAPVQGTCGSCRDLDGDGAGTGRCIEAGASPIDCNDRDPGVAAGRELSGERCGPDEDTDCDGVRDDLQLAGRLDHCGGCFNRCADVLSLADTMIPGGELACLATAIGWWTCGVTCAPGRADCDGLAGNGCEASLDEDTSCGQCRNDCTTPLPQVAQRVCEGATGQCRLESCFTDFGNCDSADANGCEVDLRTNTLHCGACGNDCTDLFPRAVGRCRSGRCGIDRCRDTWGNCDSDEANGCEQTLLTDPNHCGACGRVCNLSGATSRCTDGQCQIEACLPGRADCDGIAANGCEVVLATNATHCGRCNNRCQFPNASAVCEENECRTAACNLNWGDCDRQPANGCEQSLQAIPHCGACQENCASIAAHLRACRQGSGGRWGCVCDASAFPRELCNGIANRCPPNPIDQGCPRLVSGSATGSVTSPWGHTRGTVPLSPAPIVTQQSPPAGGSLAFTFLMGGLDVLHDRTVIIQLAPAWFRDLGLQGVGSPSASSEFSRYLPSAAADMVAERSSAILGVPDIGVDVPRLMTLGLGPVETTRITCRATPGPGATAFGLPVALELYIDNTESGVMSGIALVCQAWEVVPRVAAGTDPMAWWQLRPTGSRWRSPCAGRCNLLQATLPEPGVGTHLGPILRIQAEPGTPTWPVFQSQGFVDYSRQPLRALRVTSNATVQLQP